MFIQSKTYDVNCQCDVADVYAKKRDKRTCFLDWRVLVYVVQEQPLVISECI